MITSEFNEDSKTISSRSKYTSKIEKGWFEEMIVNKNNLCLLKKKKKLKSFSLISKSPKLDCLRLEEGNAVWWVKIYSVWER